MSLAVRLAAVVVSIVCIGLAVVVIAQPRATPSKASTSAVAQQPAPVLPAAQDPTTALFIGDSYANGTIEPTAAQTFVTRTCLTLELICNLDVEGGTGYLADGHDADSTFGPFDHRLSDDAAQFRADLVVVSGGPADVGRPGDEYAAAAHYLHHLRSSYPKALVIVLEPFSAASNPSSSLIEVRAAVKRAATSAGVDYLPTADWLTAGKAVDDGTHFNNEGQREIAHRLVKALRATGRIADTAHPTPTTVS